MIKNWKLFIDASVHPQASVAVGGYLGLTPEKLGELQVLSRDELAAFVAGKIEFNILNSNKSTFTEITTALVGMRVLGEQANFEIFTDCQSLCDLVNGRLEKLALKEYKTKAGKILGHATLYQELHLILQKTNVKVVKIKGHDKNRVTIEEKIFEEVDSLVRKKLRSKT